jgi:DNA-binding SARP family transcriptional activator
VARFFGEEVLPRRLRRGSSFYGDIILILCNFEKVWAVLNNYISCIMRYLYNMLLFLVVFSILLSGKISAQVYGLAFSGQDVNKDIRTGIDLTPDAPFEFKDEFELSFELSFIPNEADYYGYIFRIIMDDKQNYDLLRDVESNKKKFCFIAGSSITSARFNLSEEELFNTWQTFRVKFDLIKDEIRFFANDTTYVQTHIGLKKKSTFRIKFGVNHSGPFKTTDVPPMRIKDIRISNKQKVAYYWPLDEMSGNFAIDKIGRKRAEVVSPQWLAYSHFYWENIKKFTLKGLANAAFDPSAETLYLTGLDELIVLNVKTNKPEIIKYGTCSKGISLPRVWSFYDVITKKLYCYSVDSGFVTHFDFTKKNWQRPISKIGLNTVLGHHNKTVSDYDTALYIFGGYGEHKYNNSVQKLNFSLNKWETVKTRGDFFEPRYLAALGKNKKGDTIYIIGGYGSENGEQKLNSENCYDLMQYSVPNKSFKKKYDFQKIDYGFCFANSLAIDPERNSFCGFIFPQEKFCNHLQLIEGSLENNDYHFAGSKIPYNFHDIPSFADLFYCAESKILLAVTIYCDNINSEINVYSIKYPPNPLKTDVPLSEKKVLNMRGIFGILIAFITAVFFIILIFIMLERVRWTKWINKQNIINKRILGKGSGSLSVNNGGIKSNEKNSVFLFGNFQIRNKDGIDITKKFSPLILELFLLILLYSFKSNKGISTKKLDEILWPDKDEKSARNNRAVSIAKLKELINELTNCHLTINEGYWQIDLDKGALYVDYKIVIDLLKEKLPVEKDKIFDLLNIIEEGAFLMNLCYEWLDDFKFQVSNNLIDYLIEFSTNVEFNSDPNLLIRIADAVFKFDSANEDAMILKCRSLVVSGKHGFAKQTYTRFANEYKLLYNEVYKNSFDSIIKL